MGKHLKSTLLATGLASGLTLAAAAPAQAQGFEGGYAGIYAGAPFSGGAGWLGGVQGGYNFAFGGGALAGVEGDVFITNTGRVFGTALGRLGYEVGPNVMLYGAAGVGSNGTTAYYQLGAGGEANVTDNIYLRGGVDRLKPFSGRAPAWLGKIGAGYRF